MRIKLRSSVWQEGLTTTNIVIIIDHELFLQQNVPIAWQTNIVMSRVKGQIKNKLIFLDCKDHEQY